MYLHIGGGSVVSFDALIGIFDLDICSQSHLTRKYLTLAERAGQVKNVAEDIPKSFVVCREGGKVTVYLSQMACATLLRRAEAGVI